MKRLDLTKKRVVKNLGKILGLGLILLGAAGTLSAQSTVNFGRLPLWFEAAPNPSESSVSFVARGRDSAIMIGATNVQFAFLQSKGKEAVAQMQFAGANPFAPTSGALEMPGKVNYLIGNDRAQWRTGLSLFSQVRVDQLYPGINVVYYGSQQQLEYDFDLAPGANPGAIVFRFSGTDKISVDDQGELVLQLNGGQVVERRPVAYQITASGRQEVSVGYKITDAHTAEFAVGRYNHHLPLIIDPVINYSTYFGGAGVNNATIIWGVALHTNDNSLYVAGQTASTQLGTAGAYQQSFQGGATNGGDAFVAKFAQTGTNLNLVYCTYLGGSLDDLAYGLAVDAAGNVFLTGKTVSANFPVHNPVILGAYNGGQIQGTYNANAHQYPYNSFVSELNTNGSQLIYSTYLSGGTVSLAFGIALDPADNAYVTGTTFANNFPTTTNAFQKTSAMIYTAYDTANAFVSEIASNGNAMVYSTYLGGINFDVGTSIAYDNGYLAVAGFATSTNFPTTNFINQTVVNEFASATNAAVEVYATNHYTGSWINNVSVPQPLSANLDAFVTEFTVTNTGLVPRYSTFLGDQGIDQAAGVAVDTAGNAYVVGGTTSPDFPNTTNGQVMASSISTNLLGTAVTNAFLTQIQYAGTNAAIGFSRMFGGAGQDTANAITLGPNGDILVVGGASSTNFPITANLMGSLASTNAGLTDAFITVFQPDFNVFYSAYLGGENFDSAHGVVADSAGNVYVAGHTISTYFPTFNAYEGALQGSASGFLVKILPTNTIPELTLQAQGTNVLVSWPVLPFEQATTNYIVLQSNTNLLSTNWMPVTQAPVLTNATYIYTFGQTNPMLFFQLQSF